MITKGSFTGAGMIKYGIAFWMIKLSLIAILVFNVIIPFGGQFLDELTLQLNSHVWNMRALFTPIGWMVLYFIGLVLVEMFTTFVVIFPLAKRHINKMSRRW